MISVYAKLTFSVLLMNVACLISRTEISLEIDWGLIIVKFICDVYFLFDAIFNCFKRGLIRKKTGYFRDFLNLAQLISIIFGFFKIQKSFF